MIHTPNIGSDYKSAMNFIDSIQISIHTPNIGSDRTYRSQYNRIRRSQDEEQLKENKENEKIKELEQINAQLRSDYESLQQKLKIAADRADEYQEQYQKLRKEYEKEVRKRKYLLAYLTLESGVI